MHFNNRNEIIALTPLWKGERLPDGRPKVEDKYLDALYGMTLEEVWKPIFVLGYEHQFVGGGENPLTPLHDDGRKLVGREVCIRESNPNGFNGHIFAGYRGRRLGNMPDITFAVFLVPTKICSVKTARTENGLFLLRFVEDDAGIPGVFQGGRNGISAKRTVFGVRVRLSYA